MIKKDLKKRIKDKKYLEYQSNKGYQILSKMNDLLIEYQKLCYEEIIDSTYMQEAFNKIEEGLFELPSIHEHVYSLRIIDSENNRKNEEE